MDTTSGLHVLKEHKDRINKKTTFPTIKTSYVEVCIETRTKLPLMIFDKCQCCQEFSVDETCLID